MIPIFVLKSIDTMQKELIEKEIKQLRELLNHHNHLYYVESLPEISDYEFDALLKKLELLEKENPEFFSPNSPTQRVGSDINQSFKQIKHKRPMLSLSNTYSHDELLDFDNRIKKLVNEPFEYVCELKFDGSSISITYKKGELTEAVTRGDGSQGDDVINNVRTINSIPLSLKGNNFPKELEVRGEILMPFKTFENLNEIRIKEGDTPFANPRNAASGTLKLQNSREVSKRKLDAFFYSVFSDELNIDGHYESLEIAKDWGIKISDHIKKAKNIDEVIQFIEYWDKERFNLPVATDGIVIKVNSRHLQNNLGFTSKSPRWAVAYKFKAEQASTKLESISYQVGRTGAITPVANLQPVQLAGTIVKRASLHNADIIENLNLHINDTVFVEKGGEIIPKIVGVDTECRGSTAQKIKFIEHCPECKTTLIREEGEAAHYCPNQTSCSPQLKGKIEHFISRKAMNIDGLGQETIDLLFKQGLVNNVSDLYALQTQQLIGLERMGEKSAERIITSINQSKQIPFERVLFALGIRHIGETVAKKLVRSLHTIEALQEASLEKLINIDEIGEKIALSIVEYFSQKKNIELIDKLKMHGLKLSIDQDELVKKSDKLEGVTIVISGTFNIHSRDELKKIIEDNGGKNSGSISKKTSFLLAGDNIGPSKLEKAEKLGIKIINESDFLELLETK